jgi:hypothetical protein
MLPVVRAIRRRSDRARRRLFSFPKNLSDGIFLAMSRKSVALLLSAIVIFAAGVLMGVVGSSLQKSSRKSVSQPTPTRSEAAVRSNAGPVPSPAPSRQFSRRGPESEL